VVKEPFLTTPKYLHAGNGKEALLFPLYLPAGREKEAQALAPSKETNSTQPKCTAAL
jgi:hypothetical protein